ncbi:TIGR01212 family radical SAM protein [Marinifilum caeruleilacunae]|uniref:TIGR01212 family radical SAM protein n=1 Tax=Marinifilum caeruleilacunae TaxID=2499076 RepID=A0ABX1WT97_9BACT|nr:TIGR01212 family radical SAM protein [Marinifilum caeruleilacunae]NOU59206.1 TIGR01212 family radical SAM protein [Marinifilum caeruleilacunae]
MTKTAYPWGHEGRYNDFPSYFKSRFSERIQKVSIDAGFTCPNRDGSKGVGGCTYCNNNSFNPEYCSPRKSVTEQVEEGIAFFNSKYKAQKYLAYFQAYSNTYGHIDQIKSLYQEALSHEKVIGLVIGTRPDCVSDEVLDYLEELAKNYYIGIEYGVESANDEALLAINRGHTYREAEQCILRTANRGIHIGAHLVNGLPYDSKEEMLEHAIRLSKLPIESLKLHQLQILNHTQMAKEYEKDPERFYLFEFEEYLDFIVDVIERVSPDVMLERFINQAPPGWLIAPKWGIKNYQFVNKLNNLLKERNTWQGRLFEE